MLFTDTYSLPTFFIYTVLVLLINDLPFKFFVCMSLWIVGWHLSQRRPQNKKIVLVVLLVVS